MTSFFQLVSGAVFHGPGRSTKESVLRGEEGMSTAEYAIGTLAAAALAAVLYMVVTGDSVTTMLTSIIEDALSVDL
ncbi:DUF4244 domain-containing protein [Prauserella rugosa]|uniref:Uncharacterized protein DUF4244 n=1 Tax=Prauserella rugosa TaxID=43354 RepID=A0A660CC80_9PSEU|nr:DUF4244 domain-containing protein [Prauserella rugosa]KMS87870.1 hypothetical protein ACZ91_28950 [Streptomyces regensis]TWH21190.1 uncharacterized protein DUF4244 [Prauserella rugosa]